MNTFGTREKKDVLTSRTSIFRNWQRPVVALILLALVPATAIAQYPGGSSNPSYGSKGAVIGGVAAGAAAGAGLLYWKFHSRTKLQGCLSDQADKLVNEKNNRTYNLTNKQDQTLKAGERVQLVGKMGKDLSGDSTFEVHKISKDLGQCTVATAEQR
jgi:hypothetical protein